MLTVNITDDTVLPVSKYRNFSLLFFLQMQNHQKIRLCISDSTGYCGLTKTDDLIGIGPRKNPNWGVDGIMEFLPGGKSMWKFQGSVKKELEFPVVFKKNSCACGICMGLGF